MKRNRDRGIMEMAAKRVRKSFGIMLLAHALLVLLLATACGQKLSVDIEHAAQLEREGKIEKALEEYRDYLAKHPGDITVARRFLGLLFREKRNRELIEAHAELHPELQGRREFLDLVGRAHLNLEQKDEAMRIFLSIVARENGSKNSYRFVGNTFLSLGYVAEAEEVFRKGRAKWGERSFARELYHCYVREQDQERAFRELLNLSLDEAVAKEWVKRELNTLIEKDENLLRQLEATVNDRAEFAGIAGELFLEHGEIALAKKFLLHILDTEALFAFASLCITKGYPVEAEEALKKILDENDNTAVEERAEILLARTYRQAGKVAEALMLLDGILKEGTVFRDSALVGKAEVLIYDERRYEEGAKLLSQLHARNNALIQRDWFLTLILEGYIRAGDLSAAELLVAEPATPLSFFYRGEVLFLTGSFAESQKAFKSAVGRGLDRDFANNALERVMLMEQLKSKPALLSLVKDIEIVISRERYDEAIELANQGFDDFAEKEEQVVLLYCKARIFVKQERANDAVASYLNIPDESPSNPFAPKALYHAAMLYRDKIGDRSMAEGLFRRIVFDYPESVEAELSRRELEIL